MVFFALALIPFQTFKIAKGPFLLLLYGSMMYYLINSEVITAAINRVFTDKKKTNLGSITDRNLNLSFSEYLTRWEVHPFGDLWGYRGSSYSSTINLLAESMMYGPAVILLMLVLIYGAVFLSYHRIRTLSVLLLIFITCLFLQPTWLNAIWIVLIYLVTVVNLNQNVRSITSDKQILVQPHNRI